ncbi:MAG TPA: ABC transporter ATP-binding protein [Terriglobales bacterium]|nr:ABC transporter ATP-binding protein [Terriglobales bacterium]
MNRANVVETNGLTKRYRSVEAVRSLNLSVPKQQITGFLGRNGAGKSTTIKMLLGMTHPTAGTGTVLGKRIDDPKQSCEMRRCVAYIGEDKQSYAYFTVEEMIRFTKSFYADWRPEVETRLVKEYELPLNRKIRALSKGMRTKLALLLALARRPALLVLDEPSEGLDPVAIEGLLQTLGAASAEGTTVFFSSHQIAEVERVADRVCIIDHGSLVMEASLDQIRQDYRNITLGFSVRPSESDFQLDGIERIQTDGRQMTLLAKQHVNKVVERAHDLGAVSVDVTPVGLREVFLASVKGEA